MIAIYKDLKCSAKNCYSDAKGTFENNIYCPRHLMQMKRSGIILERTIHDPNEIIIYDDYAEIILYDQHNKETGRAIIDIDDVILCSKYKWYNKAENGREYALSQEKGKIIRIHRLILNFYDMSYDIDHMDGDGLNNKKSNLRIITHQQNAMNQRKLPSNNSTGYIGVTFVKNTNKFQAQIYLNDKQIYLGSFSNIEDAIEARHQAELKYFGEYKLSNFENKDSQ
jgi:hypothetical protein